MNSETAQTPKRFRFKSIYLTIIPVILAFTLGYLVRDRGIFTTSTEGPVKLNITREVPAEYQDLDFDLFWHVWNTLETSYFDKSKIDNGQMVYGAIKGMVAAVEDPYTVFLTPSENRVTQEDLSGHFGGVGIQIGFRGKQLAVVAPLPNSPAQKAGVKAGDIIAGIRDLNKDVERGTQGMTLPEAVQLIRGDIGSTVTLSLVRDGVDTPIIVDLQRGEIDVPSIVFTFEGENQNVGYIQILKFGAETKREWDEAVLEIQKKKDLEGVIVDVRNNPGGYLQAAVDLGAEFMELGSVVVIEEDGTGKKTEFKTDFPGRLTRESENGKVVVLVNGGSASASEILAGALRDNKDIKLIGENTFGKGTIQEPRQLENGVGLHLTIARWLTPSEFWVNEVGLEPDVIVEDDPETEIDEQLQTALDYFSGNSNTANIQ